MDIQEASTFKDVMGFNAGSEVFYEDDATDTSIPDIQKITKKNNILPVWGNVQTMNLNTLVLENVVQSTYWKNYLNEVTSYQQVADEVFVNVKHLEPWERGTRRTTGMTGMCGGVRGVGAGGVISTAFCLLYKLFTLRVTRKQLVAMINSRQSIYLRGIGFMYIRYTQKPADLWAWMEPYLDDDAEIDPRSGGGDTMQMGQLVRMMLTKLDFYGTLFPRIPVPIQKDIESKFGERAKLYGYEDERYGGGARRRSRSRERRRSRSKEKEREQRRSRSRERRGRSRSRDRNRRSRDRNRSREDPIKGEAPANGELKVTAAEMDQRKRQHRSKCHHHLRHHHCIKHRRKCPSKAKKQPNLLLRNITKGEEKKGGEEKSVTASFVETAFAKSEEQSPAN
ncbi:hypothetical protein niasHS_014742 [Heterodera schachtii]|uniref:Pre-mRNA-splicing factor 38 n=1 Tax=Heterodera schachtii TaxID=97005 RepID=A0ABD2INW7_HETSC